MGTGKPLVSILMAVYEPRMDWLREQLDSLEAQKYPNLRLYIRDDCSPTVPFEDIRSLVAECIRSFPYEIRRNERNMGSNLTFQALTEEAEGEYFAYCDQDDVWLPEKLEVLQAEMERSGALLVCSDMYIIDGDGKRVADSITKVRRHHVFRSGDDLAAGLLFHNFVTGCTMLVDAGTAKDAVPFCPYMVHDHYLALWAAERGSVLSLDRRLIRYRVHGGNQTGLLAGVKDKATYGEKRIASMERRLYWLMDHFPCGDELRQVISDGEEWAAARERNWSGDGGKMVILKYRYFSKLVSYFEVLASWAPEWIFRVFISIGRRNLV